MQNIFVDLEFTALKKNAEIISIALVSDTKVFYAELTDYGSVSDFVEENILPKMILQDKTEDTITKKLNIVLVKGNKEFVSEQIKQWLNGFPETKIKMIVDVGAYDWVLFCDLFGGALNLPEQIHYIPYELSTLLCNKNINPDTSRTLLVKELPQLKINNKNIEEHNALFDALLNRKIYYRLTISFFKRFLCHVIGHSNDDICHAYVWGFTFHCSRCKQQQKVIRY